MDDLDVMLSYLRDEIERLKHYTCEVESTFNEIMRLRSEENHPIKKEGVHGKD